MSYNIRYNLEKFQPMGLFIPLQFSKVKIIENNMQIWRNFTVTSLSAVLDIALKLLALV